MFEYVQDYNMKLNFQLKSFYLSTGRPRVDYINCFAPYIHLLRLMPNFGASKNLLKSWAQGEKVGRSCAKPFMKSTPPEGSIEPPRDNEPPV